MHTKVACFRWAAAVSTVLAFCQQAAIADDLRELQAKAIAEGKASWGHWGINPQKYSGWTSHTNRLVPVYTFGMSLAGVSGPNSPYRDADRLRELYGRLPEGTLNPEADYFDQTGVYHWQKAAAEAGKKYIILVIFDGMDWQTAWAASVYRSGRVGYREGRGTGLAFQDYGGTETDFGYCVTSPHNHGTGYDRDAQTVVNPGGLVPGGYDGRLAGPNPWTPGEDPAYTISQSRQRLHAYTDSAASATAMAAGIKTYNAAINVDPEGRQVAPLARQLQERGFAAGVVTNVPISHATPACAYANNVSRDDYQDLTRDMLGLPSVSHRDSPLAGLDVLIGAGWGQTVLVDFDQGSNFIPGNKYITFDDLSRIHVAHGGRYQVVERSAGVPGRPALETAAREAAEHGRRLFGFFGLPTGHLPFQTADGRCDPTVGVTGMSETYVQADLDENPTLADMTSAALAVLSTDPDGFWLMIEAGDVDWANHDNNLDNSIGAVESGDDAFRTVAHWAEARGCWQETAVIVTSDHGHYLVVTQPEALIRAGRDDN